MLAQEGSAYSKPNILHNKALVVKGEPEKISEVLRIFQDQAFRTEDGVAVRWTLDNTRVLRNLGFHSTETPSPILRNYSWPGTYQPMDHQRTTAEFLTMHRRCYLFNEQGTGKTASAIWASHWLLQNKKINRVLVICPLSVVKAAWLNDMSQILMGVHTDVAIGSREQRQKVIGSGAKYVVINYDAVVTMKRELQSGGFDLIIVDEAKNVLASYSIPAGAHIEVKEGAKVPAGQRVARTPRKIGKTKDITGGLPRVAELFEARRPKDAADIAKIDGIVEIGGTVRAKRRLIVKDVETGAEEEHLIPLNKHIIVFKGDLVKKGQQLTEGPVVPHEILDICGPQELQEHLLNEVQEVYRLQGVEINDKHIEIIVRQMLRKVKITEQGDTTLLWGDQVDRLAFEAENEAVIAKGGKPAEASPVLLGITKTALETDSFISAASFQDTTRVLTEAATLGRVDRLRGFKENVIMGHLIPAGTGFETNRKIGISHIGDALEAASKEGKKKVAS